MSLKFRHSHWLSYTGFQKVNSTGASNSGRKLCIHCVSSEETTLKATTLYISLSPWFGKFWLYHHTFFKVLDFLCFIPLVSDTAFACGVIKFYKIVKFEILTFVLEECSHLRYDTVWSGNNYQCFVAGCCFCFEGGLALCWFSVLEIVNLWWG